MAAVSFHKNTILKKYDGRLKDIFQDIYEQEFVTVHSKEARHRVRTPPHRCTW